MMFDLASPRVIHVLGASGPGMGAIARILAQMGNQVSACDVRDTEGFRGLGSDGVTVFLGNAVDHVSNVEALTYSSVITPDHPEIATARQQGIATLVRADMLAAICATRQAIGVAGTHGKTTTSGLLATILVACHHDPSYVIGGEVTGLGANAHWGSGDYLVVEADESDSTHLRLPLQGAIVTNIDVDHLDNFGTFDGIVESFVQFVRGVAGPVVLCADDPGCVSIAPQVNATTYGIESGDVRARDLRLFDSYSEFSISIDGATYPATVRQAGRHNVLNALGAVTMATRVGVPAADAVAAVQQFSGVTRRFDVRGECDGIRFIDDYAHLPAEIAAALAAARLGQSRRVVAVFQPNRFHRIAQMADSYADCFVDADLVVVTDIYASGTEPIAGVSGMRVVDAVRHAHPESRVEWCAERGDLASFVNDLLRPGDICVSMGCGDIALLPDEMLAIRQATA